MRDITLADTIYISFSTRAFATGIPTTLSGIPVVSAYEDAGLTQITAGITLGVDHDSVTGLNMLTIVATGANGFESGKDYNLVITTGTVGGVSAVGEAVGGFTVERSAAAVDLANGTDGLGVLKTDIATRMPTSHIDATAGKVDGVALVDSNSDMRGTDNAALASVCTEGRLAELNGANLPADVDAILADTGTTIPGTISTLQADTDDIQNRLPAALVSGKMDSDAVAIAGSTDSATRLLKATQCNVYCTVGSSSTTTSIITSSMDPAASVTDQFKGKIVTFDANTTTAALRGQSTDITANTSVGVLTVTALTTAAVSGDIFVIT